MLQPLAERSKDDLLSKWRQLCYLYFNPHTPNPMKMTKLPLIAVATATLYCFASCSENTSSHDDHDHPHDHDDGSEHVHGDADGDDDHDHDDSDDDHGHVHETNVAGPNGGRVITSIEPHAEFFVTADRKVQIAFVDDAIKPIPVAEQSVTVIAGDRTNPTRLTFEKSNDVLLSDKALPAGNDFPVIVQIKATPSAETTLERFNLNLSECPTCKYNEYACTCEHGADE